MKSILFENFDVRSQEVKNYFLFLKDLEHGLIQSSVITTEKTKPKKINADLTKTLKATGFLLLYNLAEATMRHAIEVIFNELKIRKISFDNITDEFKKIIIDNFKKNNSSNKLLSNINIISFDIISASFDKEKLFSGNIDAQKIKEVSIKYGFSCQTNAQETDNGSDLVIVKTNRNDLAHGFKSFEEVGKGYSVDELLMIEERVVCYLKAILENIEDYLLEQKYLR